MPPPSERNWTPGEKLWVQQQPWLEKQGYMLRPRYRPGWIPSWKSKNDLAIRYEDGQMHYPDEINSATRIADGKIVMLKRFSQERHPDELKITQLFSTEPFLSHPKNHCVPLYDVLRPPDDPDQIIIVLPLLRRYTNPSLQTVGKAVECFRQLFEGIQFMHECNVAHRDCTTLNTMLDPKSMYPNLFHPAAVNWDIKATSRAKYHSRTSRPPKYYFIDFGISERFNPDNGPPRTLAIRGGDPTAPELQNPMGPVDPFPTDVYYLGNMIRYDFINIYKGLEFMIPLLTDMIQVYPTKRPNIDEVVERFAEICKGLSQKQLRSRLVRKMQYLCPVMTEVKEYPTPRYVVLFLFSCQCCIIPSQPQHQASCFSLDRQDIQS
ncbi:hypothetical protein ABKN59_010147 [Abortiporus biennis]